MVALPELCARFSHGLLQCFDGIDIARFGSGATLARVSAVPPIDGAPAGLTILRDNSARDGRRRDILGRTRRLAWAARAGVSAMAIGVAMNAAFLLAEGGVRGATMVGVALSAWASLVGLGLTLVRGNHAHSSPIRFWGTRLGTTNRTIRAWVALVLLSLSVTAASAIYQLNLHPGAWT